MDALIGTFHIDWKIIIAQAVNFSIVLFVIYRFAVKPLGKLMNERASKIEKGLADAKIQAEMLTRTEADYEAKLAEARKEAQAVLTQVKKEAQDERAKESEKTKLEIERMHAEAKKQDAIDKAKMKEEIMAEMAGLVIASTEKVLGKAVTPHLDKEIVKESLKSVV